MLISVPSGASTTITPLGASSERTLSFPGFAQEKRFASRAAAMSTFATLLKIPLASPTVKAQVQQTTEDEGLVTEDISWDSLDGERVPAFAIRPKVVAGLLPAVVCLHGTGGSRESETTRSFGFGPWTRYGAKEPHTRLLGWARRRSSAPR